MVRWSRELIEPCGEWILKSALLIVFAIEFCRDQADNIYQE